MEPGRHPATTPGEESAGPTAAEIATPQPGWRWRVLRRLIWWLVGKDVELATQDQLNNQDSRITRLRGDVNVDAGMYKRELSMLGTDVLEMERKVEGRLDDIEKMAAEQPEAFVAARLLQRWQDFEAAQEERMAALYERTTSAEVEVARLKSLLHRSAGWVASETKDAPS